MSADTTIALFDGKSLAGWHAIPRLYSPMYVGGPRLKIDTREQREQAARFPARWSVEDGAIVGEQWPVGSGYGGFLVSDESFDDFELAVEAKPDWPVDSGILIRKSNQDWSGIQVLLDHRESGGIGGFYGNGIGGFHALPYSFKSVGPETDPTGLAIENPEESLEPATPDKARLLSYAATEQEFLAAWRWGDWNSFRIRSVGVFPRVTVWINDVLISEIDLDKLEHPHYDKHAMLNLLGRSGPIGLEVHDNDLRLGEKRWGRGAKIRFRNIQVTRLGVNDGVTSSSTKE
jgi:hypothetical protein